jgi:hypothetical protein
MAEVLAAAAIWLAGQLKTNLGTSITIIRGLQSITVIGTLASQVMRTSDREGNAKVERPDADAVLTASDYNFGAGQVEPAAGDIFQVTYGAVTKQFRAMALGSEPAWRYTDPYQTMVRVHTKFIGTL